MRKIIDEAIEDVDLSKEMREELGMEPLEPIFKYIEE